MVHSLRGRLLLITALMVFATAAVVVFVAGRTTTIVVRRLVERRVAQQHQRVERLLSEYYAEHGGWAGVEGTLAQMEHLGGERIVLVGPGGDVVADSLGEVAGPWADAEPAPPARTILAEGRVVGLVYSLPGSRTLLEELRLPYLISPALPLGALGAAVAAILLTVALSRRILGPVESLTGAVRRMESGDLTQRVGVESSDEVGTLARAFNAMADSLERQEEMRRHMVSDIAHELRSPLTNIQGYLEAAQDGLVALDMDLVASLHEEATLLGRLVRDLQDLALAEAGQLSLHREPVPLAELVDDALAMAQPHALARGVLLESHVPNGLPPLYADAQRVAQVLRNLLNNAVSATGEGDTVGVHARREGDIVHVTVRDTGCGIAPDDLPHVFDRFFRVDRARTRGTGGSGLGLAIAKQWVEAQGGRVWAESTAGTGSAFRFTVPLCDAMPGTGAPLPSRGTDDPA